VRRSGPLFVVFAGMGGTAALVPAVLPSLGSALGAPVLEAAPLLFGGLLVGVLASPLLARPAGAIGAVRAGAVVQFIALGLLAAAVDPAMVFVAAAVAGLGFGIVEASGTTLARDLGGDDVPRLLTLLTATVAVVATLAPLLVVVAGPHGFRVVIALGALAQLAAVALVRGRGLVPPRPSVRRLPAPLLLIAAALFLYVGVESTLSGFSAVTVASTLQTVPAVAAAGTSAFWLLMTAGRFAGAALLGAGMRPWMLAAVALAAVTVVLFAASLTATPVLTLVLLGIAVLACGPCYALLVSVASTSLPAGASGSIAVLIAVGAAGGAVIPAVVIAAGGLGTSTWIPAVAAVLAVPAVVLGRSRTANAS
jgi:hypothetical protein